MTPPLAGTYLFLALMRAVVTMPIGWIGVGVLVAILLARMYLAAESAGTPNVAGLPAAGHPRRGLPPRPESR